MAGGAWQCCGRRGFAGGDASGGQFVGDEPVPERGVVVVDHPKRRIDCVSRYLWAKLSWVPDSSTFDGICGLVGRHGPRQRGPREGDLADRCQHTGGVGAALRVDVGVEHSVDLLALTEHW